MSSAPAAAQPGLSPKDTRNSVQSRASNQFVDKLFKFVFHVDIDVLVLFIKFNNDVDVVFKLVIDVDKLFKFVFVAYIDKSGLFVIEL